jgi:ribosomal-protein-alanine N-acetyltransferase
MDECHIANVTVAPEARGRSVGEFLVEGILADAHRRGAIRATLEVRISNAAAIGLYEKCGFTSVAMRRKYYPDNGEDALVMWKEKI